MAAQAATEGRPATVPMTLRDVVSLGADLRLESIHLDHPECRPRATEQAAPIPIASASPYPLSSRSELILMAWRPVDDLSRRQRATTTVTRACAATCSETLPPM